jgi:hypothetical protein
MEGGPYQEFFYISIPVDDRGNNKRFVYVHEDNKKRFPMSIGNEVETYYNIFYINYY